MTHLIWSGEGMNCNLLRRDCVAHMACMTVAEKRADISDKLITRLFTGKSGDEHLVC